MTSLIISISRKLQILFFVFIQVHFAFKKYICMLYIKMSKIMILLQLIIYLNKIEDKHLIKV